MSDQAMNTHAQRCPSVSVWWLALGIMFGALVLARTGPGAGGVALAEMVSSEGVYTMMTTDGGNDEVLVVVDSSEETVMVYRVSPSGGLELLEREALDEMFTRARAQSLGAP